MKPLCVFLLGLFAFTNFSHAKLSHPKKVGIGGWEVDAAGTSLARIEQVGFGWYYNWRTDYIWAPDNSIPRTVPFVPMIWDETHVSETVPVNSGALLGFNEPDNASQANMTVDQAITLWPALMKSGLRLGSPAPTTGQILGSSSWLGRFMAQVKMKGYRVDFVAIHYYTDKHDVAAFKAYLEAVYAQYGLPIWITEWALVDWAQPQRYSLAETAAFAHEATIMLDSLPFVERHAWFSLSSDGTNIHTELLDSNNNLTAVGQVFKALLADEIAPGDSLPPTASVTSPTQSSILGRGKKIIITATASDNVGVQKVLFYVNGSAKCTVTVAPFKCSWTTPKKSSDVILEVEAVDAAGNRGRSNPVKVHVR